MARIDIPFIIEKQNIMQHPATKIAAGGQHYFYATFNLCRTWGDIQYKKAVFTRGNNSYIMDLLPTGDNCMECRIPWEVMTKAGYFDVGVFGGDRLPTNTARIFVINGCNCDGSESQPPTPDWFVTAEQKLAKIPQITEEYYNKLLYCDENGNICPLSLGNGLKITNGILMIVGSVPDNPPSGDNIPDEPDNPPSGDDDGNNNMPDDPTIDNTIAVLGVAMLGEIQLGSK